MTVCVLCERRIEPNGAHGYPGIVHLDGERWAHATCYWRPMTARARGET